MVYSGKVHTASTSVMLQATCWPCEIVNTLSQIGQDGNVASVLQQAKESFLGFDFA